jgi:hypothetical protein
LLYGNGTAGEQIAQLLIEASLRVEKKLMY